MTPPHRQHPPVWSAIAVGLMILSQLTVPAFAKDRSYTVRNGDNLWIIARRLDIHVKDIVQLNRINPKSELQPGQLLYLPSSAKAGYGKVKAANPSRKAPLRMSIAGSAYRVQKGDNPWTIARRFNVGTDSLLRANGLSPKSVLQLGDRITIPGLKPKVVAKAPKPARKKAASVVARRNVKPAGFVVVTRNRTPLYSQTTVSSDKLRVVGRGRRLAMVGKKGGWVKILLADGAIAWLQSQFAYREGPRVVAVIPQPARWKEENHQVVLKADVTEPARSEIDRVANAEESQFIRMLADRLKNNPEASEQVAETSERIMSGLSRDPVEPNVGPGFTPPGNAQFAKQGLRYLGTRYRRGGLSSRGMDCSGLVVRVLQDYGIDAPHNAAALFGRGRPIGKGELEPGDLVFFRNTYRRGVSHVGIYLGDTKFVHASTRGRQVRISSLGEAYYVNHWAGARRIR